ncbi:DUF2726 domain-containing protein [Halomonas dongshanensis]|uniref:DUF2726 domain-containing protein n=1 Tax=Halomonas dongshanensis TaxID=2890835 RepID=A0ABT2EHE8_9GAMM|nr:DUF2726 domain-containing protein [Halomonas dongshanensis]MCS2611037.1 DUF2726 domain-containing protein [Halomonas dongshanensis]
MAEMLVLITAALVIVVFTLWQLKRMVSGGRRYPYIPQERLNTPTEQAFYTAVQRAVGTTVLIACKVRIADVLQVRFRQRHRRDQRWWHYFRLISSKHVDLVVCEPHGGRILAAIELDDRSHRRGDRQRRDRFVDDAFASAGVPLLRFTAGGRYDVQKIQERLAPYLTTSNEGSDTCPNTRSITS